AYPAFQQAQGVIPERIDLHCLAPPWRDHPIADLGVHPGQLIALLPLAQQTILWIHPNAEVRAAQMVLDNVEQLRNHESERSLISRYVEIAIQGMEKPQGGIGRMIEALLFALGE